MVSHLRASLSLASTTAMLLAAAALPAQDSVPGGCFRGGPRERCTWFTLTEASVHYRLTDILSDDERLWYGFALGFMVNTRRGTALGGEAFAGVEGDVRGGLALRWRRWLGPHASLDLAAGVHLAGDASSGTVQPGSPMLQASLVAGDRIGATARLDVLRLKHSCLEAACFQRTDRTTQRFYLGGQVGSGLGLGAGLAAGLAFLAFALSYGN